MTVWTVHRIGTRLFDRTTGRVAACFLAVAALHVRDSHFGVTDVAATWLVTLSFLFAVEHAQTASRRSAIFSAMWAGLAAATKYNAALIALAGGWAILSSARTRSKRWSERSKLLGIFSVVVAAAFVSGTLFAVLDWRTFLTAMSEVTTHLRGGHMALAGPAWTMVARGDAGCTIALVEC